MNDITHKPLEENPLDVIKSKNELLLTRVQSFTSKEVSEACREMDEKTLERAALMCERISAKKENPSDAVIIINNLSKHKDVNHDVLTKVMDKLEENAGYYFLRHSQKVSQKLSPENFLSSLPMIERLSSGNRRAYDQSLRIDEDKMVMLSSELINTIPDRIPQCIELSKVCLDRMIKPEHLYNSLIAVAKKNPTKEQFDAIFDEFSKLIPVLRSESESAARFFMDEPGDEKIFWNRKPEWTLNYIAEKASQLTTDDFIRFLNKTRSEEDPFLSTISRREDDSILMQNFKFDLKHSVTWNAGAIAFAVALSEKPELYKLVENAFLQRNKKGYPIDMFNYQELFDPLKTLNEFLTAERKSPITYQPPEKDFPELMKGEVSYIDLKKISQSCPQVASELAALETLLGEYREQFIKRITVLTHHMDIAAEGLEKTIMSFLEIAKEKKLYGNEFVFVDYGTASGRFTNEPVSYIRNSFERHSIIRTNPTNFKIEHHDDLPVLEHDLAENNIEVQANIAVVKDVMKFFTPNGKGKVWENVTKDVTEGGVVFSGSFVELPYGYQYKTHVKLHGELVKVDENKLLAELKSVKDYPDYLARLDEIVEKCRMPGTSKSA